jgi:signal transduction histidine kinase
MNAGATELSFAVEIGDGRLRLTVRDNGPGVTHDMIHDGRGLWTLDQDLKPGGISVLTMDSGGAVCAEIPLQQEEPDGDDPAD